ncbi:MAG: hypothetical protein AAGI88_02535 [Pseudomonadota bacterium]
MRKIRLALISLKRYVNSMCRTSSVEAVFQCDVAFAPRLITQADFDAQMAAYLKRVDAGEFVLLR